MPLLRGRSGRHHKWHADPDHRDAGASWRTSHEAASAAIARKAIYALSDGTGYTVATDQLDGDSEYHVYPREGAAGNPHDHSREIAVFRGADATDGIEVTSSALGAGLPYGLLIAMNSTSRNFLIFCWQDVASQVKPALRMAGTR